MILRHYGAYYAVTPYVPADQFLLDNYEAATIPDPQVFDRIKQLDPTFPCEAYKSLTDNNVSQLVNGVWVEHPDETALKAICASLGIDIESCYLHWSDETVIDWDYTGSKPDLVTYPAGSRIEKYRAAHQSYNRLRCHTHFGAGTAAILEQSRLAGTATYNGHSWDGLMSDNAGRIFQNIGTRCMSGGHCAEFGGGAVFTVVPGGGVAPAFTNWRWALQRSAMIQLRAILNAAGKKYTINVSTDFHDDYANYQVADRIHEEAEGSPTRSAVWGYANMRARHVLCASKGIILNMGPINSNYPIPNTDNAAKSHDAMCMSLVIGEAFSGFACQDWTGPWEDLWPQNVIPPSSAIVKATVGPRLGNIASSDPEIFLTGTDNLGQPFTIYYRGYTKGAPMLRMKSPYNGNEAGEVTFSRPWNMRVVDPHGVITTPATITMKNGSGVLLIV